MLDHIYAGVAHSRRRWYERHPEARRRLQRPVISVGNASVGGTGKTPLVRQLAEWLIARGERPAILSRGYQRDDPADGVTVVSTGSHLVATLPRAGDEPLMLARQLPGAIVCVAEDRHVAGAVAERALGATVHLLDDGFQHLHLARDYDILVTSPGEITAGRVLPFGRLREPRGAAARAHFVVVVGADRDQARSEAWELGISQFAAARRVLGAPGAQGAPGASGADLANAIGNYEVSEPTNYQLQKPITNYAISQLPNVAAVAGIAHPEQFFEMLRAGGYDVGRTLAFGDHHRFTAADIRKIGAAAGAAGGNVVLTTEKDAVRLEALGPLPFVVAAVPMRLEIDGWDELTAAVDQALGRRREAA